MRRVRFDDGRSAAADEDGVCQELHPALQWDLAAVVWLMQLKEDHIWLSSLVHATSSRHRANDISLLIWLVFIAMVPEFGLPYFWMCVGNLLAVVGLQFLAQTARPLDVQPSLWRLVDRRCVDQDTAGFPCVDCHMAVVVFLPAILHTQSLAVQAVFSLIVAYFALCKLLLGTRFISQVLGSWFTGYTGILLGNHGHIVVKSYKLSRNYTTGAIVALLVLLMGVLGTWIENNESSLLGIPKQDFLEVFFNILNSDAPKPPTVAENSPSGAAQVHQLPARQLSTRRDEGDDSEDGEELSGKRDSFYFLVRGMRARARATRGTSYRDLRS